MTINESIDAGTGIEMLSDGALRRFAARLYRMGERRALVAIRTEFNRRRHAS